MTIAFGLLISVLTIVVHVALAMAVYDDANRLDTGRVQPLAISPTVWTLTALLGGLPAVAVYWVIYHSSLRR
ncbi:MAG TPA: hypothetical protein VGG64_06695 [Pirellulales bacterium]|nr:hypothetical protein [Pirellulales bacterium]